MTTRTRKWKVKASVRRVFEQKLADVWQLTAGDSFADLPTLPVQFYRAPTGYVRGPPVTAPTVVAGGAPVRCRRCLYAIVRCRSDAAGAADVSTRTSGVAATSVLSRCLSATWRWTFVDAGPVYPADINYHGECRSPSTVRWLTSK